MVTTWPSLWALLSITAPGLLPMLDRSLDYPKAFRMPRTHDRSPTAAADPADDLPVRRHADVAT